MSYLINQQFPKLQFCPSSHSFDFSIQWHHAMCHRGSHLEFKLTALELDTWHTVCHCHSNFAMYPTRRSFPRKTCKFRLSQNSTKIDVVARFHETIPTVKSILSSVFYRNYDFSLFEKNWIFSGFHRYEIVYCLYAQVHASCSSNKV